jgi:hypothetical protein
LILLGQCAAPRIGWQIDPFGHSSENARLFKWLGFDGLFFARNDYREKEQMIANKSLDLIWNAGETLPGLSKYYFLYTTTTKYPAYYRIHHMFSPMCFTNFFPNFSQFEQFKKKTNFLWVKNSVFSLRLPVQKEIITNIL